MSEKKILKDEELNKVAGGCYYKSPELIVFAYEKGYTQEICDYNGQIITSIIRTHRATVIKRGYIQRDSDYIPVYYFQGVPNPEPDVDGWYREEYMGEDMENYNFTRSRTADSEVVVVD